MLRLFMENIKKDTYNLDRFLQAQEDIYESVITDLKNGNKKSHWMWYIFPQIKGLGLSPLSVKYSLSSLEEAREYLKHPILGPRLRECTTILLKLNGKSAIQIFGNLDALKLKSSMTVFSVAEKGENIFDSLIDKYFEGSKDLRTLELM